MLVKAGIFRTMFFLLLTYFCLGMPQIQAEQVEEPVAGKIYIEKNAHPLEGCVYRQWNVLAATPIYTEPNPNSQLIATAQPGDLVQALTGILYVKPARFVVTKEYAADTQQQIVFREGDTGYVLAYVGEGFFKVWHKGKIEIISPFGLSGFNSSPATGREWGTMLDKYEKAEWWIQMTLANGVTGWAKDNKNFGYQSYSAGNSLVVIINGKRLENAQGAYSYLDNGSAMVDVVSLAERLEFNYNISNNNVITLLAKDNTKAELVLNAKTAFVNGSALKLDTAPLVKNNHVYIPLSFLRYFLKAKIEFNAEPAQVKVTTGK